MELEEVIHLRNPWDEVNVVSRLFFSWIIPFFIKGNKKDLEVSDLYKCPKVDRSETLGDELQRQWEKEMAKVKKGQKPSLSKALLRMFGFSYTCIGIFCFIEECFIRVLQPVLLGWVVRYFSHPEDIGLLQAYLSAGGVCLLAAFYTFTHHPYFFGMCHMGMKIRVSCCSLMYRKALKLSRASLGRTTVGQMVNLLSNDVNRFDNSVLFFPYLLVGPLQTAIIVAVLWQHLGPSCLAGVSILILYVPFQGAMGSLFSKLRIKTAVLTDERVRLMNEFISGMRVLKMYTWETPFAELVMDARRREVKKIRSTAILRGVNMSMFFVSSKIILFLCFISFVMTGNQLTAEAVFVSMALFNNLRTSMTLFFPYGISMGSETLISIRRLQKFMLLEEQAESPRMNGVSLRPPLSHCGIWMDKITATWNKVLEEPTLRDISVSVRPGELLAVVGSVGSGKTSLLMAILGELPISSGDLKIRGKVAYASQEPWSFSGNIRQNVIFGSPFDERRYKTVIHVCALEKDLLQLHYGDKTFVGERGVSLSGGQKARMNLARALYYDADIYLLDDPLSAVDTAVAKHIFQKCIVGYLKDKVRILVTHQLQFIKQATKVLVLKEGKCLALGSYEQLVNSGLDFVSLMEEIKEEDKQPKELQCPNPIADRKVSLSVTPDSMNGISLYESTLSISSLRIDESSELSLPMPHENSGAEPPRQEDEMRTMGSVKGVIYWKYIRAGAGPFLLFVLLFSNILTQALFNCTDFWLTLWTNNEEKKGRLNQDLFRNETNSTISSFNEELSLLQDNDRNMYIYTGLVVALFFAGLIRTVAFFIMCMKASVNLHNSIFKSITRAPISFFDNNPVGPILNRCSRDLGVVDDLLPSTAYDCLEIALNMTGILVVVAIINRWILIPTTVLGFFFFYLRRFYIRTARDVKRLEGITRSPVFSHLSTSLYGLATLRAFKAQQSFEEKFDHHQNEHSAAWFLFISATRWLGIVLDWFCVLYITIVTMSLMVLADSMPGGNAGLAIASALMLTGMFQWGIRQSAEVESQMTSVERILEYTQLPAEAALTSSPEKTPPPNWPLEGAVIFQNVSLTYSLNDPPVLKNLNFAIKPKEKVGIVGRTGAGKSSLIAALFRMTEPEGAILIDGINIKDVGLHDLRKKISIIPQDPVLFTGPVRRNLDPFGSYQDEQLWNALEEVQLKEAVQELPGGLDTPLSEGGSNFSVGQRQLVCLARAILRQNRVLVLDEATANVDLRTDLLIQQTIREKFTHCTVLTIAHRLNTIMDSDRVLVLDAGEVKEFDEPHILLLDRSSIFSSMVEMTGKSMAEQLREIARKTYIKRHPEIPAYDIDNTRKNELLVNIALSEQFSEKDDSFQRHSEIIDTEEDQYINVEDQITSL